MIDFAKYISDFPSGLNLPDGVNSMVQSATRQAYAKIKQSAPNLLQTGNLKEKLFSFFNKGNSQSNTKKILAKPISNTAGLDPSLKDISCSIDELAGAMNIANISSFVNIGLSCVNLAVSVAGFVMISNQLNELSADVKQVLHTVEKIANVQKNNLLAEYQKLIMRFNSMSEKIGLNEPVSMDEMETLIIDMRAYISEMVMNLADDAIETEVVLKVINALLPAYTQLFHEFLKRYYYSKEKLPANYNMFLDLYREMDSEKFRRTVEEFLFVNEGRYSMDVFELTNVQMLIGVNHRVQIEDQAELLQSLKTKENIEAYEKKLDEYVVSFSQI